ncbi:hypothetical protein NLI96_g5786 [Meripilus lineatus]|uniref:F-box domain-containing protein n=1 Tax=Meripilus lineatus TaxID=2056292 RepID=A0AAD5V745_9APHY|nr:hypothetical protein NLI96_g5786 [Physisporinus lineatus]
MSRLHIRLNSLSGTACLPTELYYEIFLHYLASFRGMPEEAFALRPLMHTCSHWRRIVTDLPFLWRRIVISPSKDWTKLALQHSKQCPLIIEAKASKVYKRVLASLKVALAQMKRIEGLHLALPPAAYDNLKTLLNHPAPILRDIHLDATHLVASREVKPFPWGRNMSSLREIYTTLPLSTVRSVLRSSVRSIYLDFESLSWTHRANISSDLLPVLKSLPSLERFFINTRHSDTPQSSEVVSLPCLKFLEVHAHEDFVMRLIDSLQIPKHALLRIITRPPSFMFQPPRNPFAIVLASHAATYLDVHKQDQVLLDLSNATKLSQPRLPEHDSRYWAAQLDRPRDYETLEVAISSNVLEPSWLCNKLTLSAIQVLWLNLVDRIPASSSLNPFGTLKSVFREMRDVRTLILEGWPETCVAEALATTVDSLRELPGRNPSPRGVLFPILETLVLKNAKFGKKLGKGPDDFYRELVKGLLDRATLLGPIRTLIIEKHTGLSRENVFDLEIQTGGLTEVFCTDEFHDDYFSTGQFPEGMDFDRAFGDWFNDNA